MSIRNRIALQFSLIVTSILVGFSVVVYLTSATYWQEEFYERLHQKALTTTRLLMAVDELNKRLLEIIDSNTSTALINEKVLVFDANDDLVYSSTSTDDQVLNFDANFLQRVRTERMVKTVSGKNEVLGLLHGEGRTAIVVLVSAYDEFGKSKLRHLRRTLIWSLLAGVGLTIGLSIFFAGQSLRPIGALNRQIQTITERNLRQRLAEGHRRDEVEQLAVNFNTVLHRLEQAFEQQRSFVSHASHELRTPLAALKSEIQLGLRHPLSPEASRHVLQTLLSDTDRLINLTNALLFLARTLENVGQVPLREVRMEEAIALAQEELLSARPGYQIHIAYEHLPESETQTLVAGNEELLKRVLLNLFDNACKYSPDHTARVFIGGDAFVCRVRVRDSGIGIAPDDLPRIFEPFYRATNAAGISGFGVGLSICQRIMEMHRGQLFVESTLGEGSCFTLEVPHL